MCALIVLGQCIIWFCAHLAQICLCAILLKAASPGVIDHARIVGHHPFWYTDFEYCHFAEVRL